MSSHHVCPWWFAYTFDNPFRKLFHDPAKILGDYVRQGMTVMDIGCGMGYFSIGMAELVGDTGKVLAVDLQQEMLDIMHKRAAKKGVVRRIIPHRAQPDSINISTPVDFALAFWMVHETPDPAKLFREVKAVLRPSSYLLYTEPAFHVPAKKFSEILAQAEQAGLRKTTDVGIRFSHAALLQNMTDG